MQASAVKLDMQHNVSSFTAVVYIAFAALFIPTFYKLFTYGWRQADYSHGPLILLVFFWMLWEKRVTLSLPEANGLQPAYLALLLLGLLLYAFGSTSRVIMFESFSLIPILLGVSGFLCGKQAIKGLLFPAAFLIFLVPPPLFLIDYITSPLKTFVAAASTHILSGLGYPISRSGVYLYIGDYSIIVGDACSGLRSFVSLMTVGALYTYMQKISTAKKGLLFLSIIPISVFANIMRLILLCLITYHFGDAAGQGFFHNFSGFLLFIVALAGLVLIDALLDRWKNTDEPHQA